MLFGDHCADLTSSVNVGHGCPRPESFTVLPQASVHVTDHQVLHQALNLLPLIYMEDQVLTDPRVSIFPS